MREIGQGRDVLESSPEIAEVLGEVEGGDGDRRPVYNICKPVSCLHHLLPPLLILLLFLAISGLFLFPKNIKRVTEKIVVFRSVC